MKTIFKAIAIFALTSSSAFAVDKFEVCGKLNESATLMMTNRQNGHSLKKLMGDLNSIKVDASEEAAMNVYREMLVNAFQVPAYRTSELKEKAITDFADKYYSNCLMAFN